MCVLGAIIGGTEASTGTFLVPGDSYGKDILS